MAANPKQKSCILISGHSGYDALSFFTASIQEAFERKGYACYAVDNGDTEAAANKLRYLTERKNISFALGFNLTSVCYREKEKMYTVFETFKKKPPFFAFMVDNPVYVYKRLLDMSGNIIYSFVCREHMELARSAGKSRSFFIPHGACMSELTRAGEKPIKDIEVLFGGSVNADSVKELYESGKGGDELFEKVFYRVYEYMRENPEISYARSVELVSGELGIEPGDDWFMSLCGALRNVDSLVRVEKRIDVLRAIAESGVKIKCFGSFTDTGGLLAHENIEIRGSVSFGDMMNLITRAKITVNVMPNFAYGLHERLLSAMINGSVCLSDTNPFIREHFTDGADMLFYSHRELGEIGKTIESALADSDLRETIAENAGRKVAELFTWDSAAEAVLRLVEETGE